MKNITTFISKNVLVYKHNNSFHLREHTSFKWIVIELTKYLEVYFGKVCACSIDTEIIRKFIC